MNIGRGNINGNDVFFVLPKKVTDKVSFVLFMEKTSYVVTVSRDIHDRLSLPADSVYASVKHMTFIEYIGEVAPGEVL